jgi:V/A-type H+/Na+-transporting ATPase subunit C
VALERAAAEYFAFFAQYVLDRDRWLLDLFRLHGLFRMLKTGVKRSLAQDGEERPKALKAALEGFAGPQADRVRGVATAAAARYEENPDPAGLDTAFDRLEHDMALELARPSEFLAGFYRLHADVENLRTFMRVKAASDDGSAAAEFRRAFLPGGILDEKTLAELLAQPCDTAVEQLTKAPPFGCGSEMFFDYIEQGSCEGLEKRSIVRMERLGRELELRYLRQTRYATFGHEPLVTFYMLQENELRNLRQLHAAKVAGLPAELTQDLVAYVD